mmetsp:Transcript_2416/g.7262  ORF Transcript_2416/g.7262 Transcript_2416/m.7262 type:complete len:113 (-) Transcript_2416:1332-1670(-)
MKLADVSSGALAQRDELAHVVSSAREVRSIITEVITLGTDQQTSSFDVNLTAINAAAQSQSRVKTKETHSGQPHDKTIAQNFNVSDINNALYPLLPATLSENQQAALLIITV